MQTHISESPGEIEFVKQQFPKAKDYTDVYDRFGLLGPTSLFAHAIHLSERECARMSETGSAVLHCPTSNNFLGSGLFRYPHLARQDRSVGVGVATDVGGGTSYSMLQTLGEAYKVAMNASICKTRSAVLIQASGQMPSCLILPQPTSWPPGMKSQDRSKTSCSP
jgi:guanine deaminase